MNTNVSIGDQVHIHFGAVKNLFKSSQVLVRCLLIATRVAQFAPIRDQAGIDAPDVLGRVERSLAYLLQRIDHPLPPPLQPLLQPITRHLQRLALYIGFNPPSSATPNYTTHNQRHRQDNHRQDNHPANNHPSGRQPGWTRGLGEGLTKARHLWGCDTWRHAGINSTGDSRDQSLKRICHNHHNIR